MGRRLLAAAGSALLVSTALAAGQADAAMLEAMGGCTLKPAQGLRVVSAEPTRLSFSFTYPPGSGPACVDHYVASIYEAGSIRPLFGDVAVAAAPAPDAAAGAPTAAAFSFDGLEPAHEYRAIVTAVPASRATPEYARAVTHAAAVVVTVTPGDPVADAAARAAAAAGQQGASSGPSSSPVRHVVHVMPPPSPRPAPPAPPPAAAPPAAAPAPAAKAKAAPRGGGGPGRPSRPSGGRQQQHPPRQQPQQKQKGQDFRPAGAAPHGSPPRPAPADAVAGHEGADAAAASAGSARTEEVQQKQQQKWSGMQIGGGAAAVGSGAALGGSGGDGDGLGLGLGNGGEFAMADTSATAAAAATGRGRRRGGGGGAGRHGGGMRASPGDAAPAGDQDDGRAAASAATATATGVALEPWASEALDFAARQLAATVQDLGPDARSVPRSAQAGVGVRMEEVVSERGLLGWTAGFFPGSLWLLYEYLSMYAGGGAAGGGGGEGGAEAAAAAPLAAAPASGGRRAGRGGHRNARRSSGGSGARGAAPAGARRRSGGRQAAEEVEDAALSAPLSPAPLAPAPAPPAYPPIYGDAGAAAAAAEGMLAAALSFTDLMEPVQRVTNDHDVGFVAYCSYGQGLRVLLEQQREQEDQEGQAGDTTPAVADADAPASAAAPPPSPDLASYREVLLRTADALATRFDPDVGATASWDWWGSRGRDFPVIVDNMMNTELLFWAEKELLREAAALRARAAEQEERRRGGAAVAAAGGEQAEAAAAAQDAVAGMLAAAADDDAAAADIANDTADADADAAAAAAAAVARAAHLRRVAELHVRTTLRNHFRDDAGGSAWHLVNYDPLTGRVWRRQNYQGYDDESAWARGQGWALYGLSFAFRETGDRLLLRRAVRLADWLYAHPNMPEDGVPYWDYSDPRIPDVPRDASAGAVYASALYELSRHVRGDEGDPAWDGGGAVLEGAGGPETSGNGVGVGFSSPDADRTFPVAPPELEAAADARWASLSAAEREAAAQALRARLRGHADRTLLALASAEGGYRETVVGANDGFVLRHSVGSLNERLMLEIDAPLNYADYYFLEAMLRRVQTRAELEQRRRTAVAVVE